MLQKLVKERKAKSKNGQEHEGEGDENRNLPNEEKPMVNMKEILKKAEIRRWGKPKEKVNLQHMSPERVGKKRKIYEEVSKTNHNML